MIITKMALAGGRSCAALGATIALPFLDAMVPALSARRRPRRQRLGLLLRAERHVPAELPPAGDGGTDFELTPVLQAARGAPRARRGGQRAEQHAGAQPTKGGGVHTRDHAGWLSGVLPKRTEGANITSGKTIDQYAADKLGADTPLRSLELTLESNFQVGNCENGYSCAYLNSTSWRAPEHAAAARARSARRVPAAVRRRRQRVGAAGADAEGPQHPRFGDGEHRPPREAARRRAIAGRWATTSTRCATSSSASSGPSRPTRATPLPARRAAGRRARGVRRARQAADGPAAARPIRPTSRASAACRSPAS